MRRRTREGTGGKCVAEPPGSWPAGVLGQRLACRVRADHTGSQYATRRAEEKLTAQNYISRQNTIVQESVQWVPWPGWLGDAAGE